MMVVTDYGASALGVIDSTAAIQTVINLATASAKGATVFLPRGSYKITDTLTIPTVNGMKFVGDGLGTRLNWAGAADRPMIRLAGVQRSEVASFEMVGGGSFPLAVGIQVCSVSGATYGSKQNRFRNLALGGMAVGIQIGGPVGGTINLVDANNDYHTFDQVWVDNYTDTAFSLENTQVYNLQFRDCMFNANGVGLVGLSTTRNAAASTGGNFSWVGGGGGGCQTTDFSLSPHSAPYRIADATFEGSKRFMTTGGPSGASGVIIIESCRFSADSVHADRQFIQYLLPGILLLRGNVLGGSTPNGDTLLLHWNPGGAAGLRRVALDSNLVGFHAIGYSGLTATSDVGTIVL